MPLTLPNLDDRSFADLMDEARSLLVTYAPALTNHNPSDPLITLTEMFAYLTEVLLFRLNLVTDDNRRAFLRLLNGPKWKDPQTHGELAAATRETVLNLRRVDRAVTAADFEVLALTADPRVARAKCHPNLNLASADPVVRATRQPGHVSVVIVPAVNANLSDLITTVGDYIEPRRMLGTRLHVVGPRPVPLTVQVTLNLLPDTPPEPMPTNAAAALKRFFDPVVGRDGTGWPFGRDVYVSEIYRLLDGLAGVDFVTRTPVVPAPTPPAPQMLDEIDTTDEFRIRFVRNEALELISLPLQADEMADVSVDIKTRLPPA